MNHFNYGIIIGAIESAPLLGAYDELGEEKPNLHPYDVFFHYFDRALSSYGFYLVKYCFTT